MAERYTVYSIVKREGLEDFWLNLGVAFPHEDGKGFNVFLQALPLGDKLVLREPKSAQGGDADNNRRDDSRQDSRPQGRDRDSGRDDRRQSGRGGR